MSGRYKNQGTVEITVEGTRYKGDWNLEKGLITVRSAGLGSDTTQLGNLKEEELARQLLHELVQKARSKKQT
jgi:hypothetical protein